jgi:hypothetical protein
MDLNLGRGSDDDADDTDAGTDGGGTASEWFGGGSDDTGGDDSGGRPDRSGGSRFRSGSGSGSGSDSDSSDPGDGVVAGLSSGVDRVRRRVDPRETAEKAARGTVRLVLRVVGAVLVAYGLWVLVAVDGWARLGAAAVAVGFLPAFAPGFVIGLFGVLWRVFNLA